MLQRDDLLAGACLDGPAIVEQMDTTTVIPPGSSTRVGADGSLHIDLTPGAPGKEAH